MRLEIAFSDSDMRPCRGGVARVLREKEGLMGDDGAYISASCDSSMGEATAASRGRTLSHWF